MAKKPTPATTADNTPAPAPKLPNAVVANQGEPSTGTRKPQVEELPGKTTKVTF